MKRKLLLFIMLLLVFISYNFIVHADWNALNSGYAVTTDTHGEDLLLGTPVTVIAGTTDEDVSTVVFVWKWEENEIWTSDHISVEPNGTQWNGKDIYYANETRTPNKLDDWGIQAFFYNATGHIRGEDIVRIRATSLTAVPEVPFGTLAIIAIMFGALGLFALKKKHNFQVKIPSRNS